MTTLNVTLNRKTKRPRKPGSGRKRKIGAVTSQDYAQQLKELEKREAQLINMTPQQREALKKKKRSLKNRMSALRSRENKRTKVARLEQAVESLQREIEELKRENRSLRQSTSSTETMENTVRRKRCRSSCTATTKENSISQKNVQSVPTSPSSPSNNSAAQKPLTPVKPFTHNCGSAESTPRSVTSNVTGQYSHMLWEMPRLKTLRSIFLKLWIISKTLIASRKTKDYTHSTANYRQTQRALRRIFSKTLTSSPVQQQASNLFDRISQKFLAKAVTSVSSKPKSGCVS